MENSISQILDQKPKRLRTAWIFFVNEKKAEKDKGYIEFVKDLAKIWKNMSDEEKLPYKLKEKEDSKRFSEQYKKYAEVSKGIKMPEKPHGRPKRYYFDEIRHTFESKSAHLTQEKLEQCWKTLDEPSKLKYHKIWRQEQERYK